MVDSIIFFSVEPFVGLTGSLILVNYNPMIGKDNVHILDVTPNLSEDISYESLFFNTLTTEFICNLYDEKWFCFITGKGIRIYYTKYILKV
jgi:hypothetical protein